MRRLQLKITQEHSGALVGYLLKNQLGISSRLLSKLKRCGEIRLNQSHVTVRSVVSEGDLLEVFLPEESSETILPSPISLCILYEDEDLLVVNKPAGMPVHPSLNHQENTLGNAVCYHWKDHPFVYRPVNRLDKDTTGIVVVAKTQHAGFQLSRQMQDGRFQKIYYAVTARIPIPPKGIIDAPIRRETDSIIKRCVSADGQKAVTQYRVLSEKDGKALVEVKLLTGRTHQIRVHFAHIGAPLYADYLYGKEIPNTHFLLHCRQLEFWHPVTEKKLCFTCPSPFEEDFSISQS